MSMNTVPDQGCSWFLKKKLMSHNVHEYGLRPRKQLV